MKYSIMKPVMACLLLLPLKAHAFCGFYVAKAGAALYNEKSEVIMVRNGTRTVITMSNDFKGTVKDFAMVVPVPTVLQERDIRVVDRGLFDRWDAYSAPRLVEYYDANPCAMRYDAVATRKYSKAEGNVPMSANISEEAENLGVHIEASYTIGEYDILILSAQESGGLKTWLTKNGYSIPQNAEEVLQPYILSGMKFFVVKVNLETAQQTGYQYLRPIQIEFQSDRFMLPIRLGMANSNGEQDLIIYAITREGAVETSNYRNVRMTTARKVPTFVKNHFDRFYVDLFARQHANEGNNAVFTEYAWDVTPNWGIKCDPCVGNPPAHNDLLQSGVNWLTGNGGQEAFFTRLHVRYSRNLFPQDLMFTVTGNREQHQARYILTWPAVGAMDCREGRTYLAGLGDRRRMELMELGALTGWNTALYSSYINDGKDPGVQEPKRGALPVLYDKQGGKPQGPNGGAFWILLAGILATAVLLAVEGRLKAATA
jgi:hypothetical protein